MDPEIVVHWPLPEPTDEGVGYDPEPKGREGDEQRTLPPDPYHVLLLGPAELLDPDALARLSAAVNAAGATNIHVELAQPGVVGPEMISGLRQLGNETGAARIDVHAASG